MNREEKRARDLRYDATEKGQANRQRKVAAFHERYDSDPAYRERRLPAARLWRWNNPDKVFINSQNSAARGRSKRWRTWA